jgi:hypothetical protein
MHLITQLVHAVIWPWRVMDHHNTMQNLPCVSLLELSISDYRLPWVFSRQTFRDVGNSMKATHLTISRVFSFLSSRFCGHDTNIWALLSVIWGSAVGTVLWTLDLWSSRWTVFVETWSPRWIFNSAVTCAAIVLWFFQTVLLNVWRSLSVNVDFHPLFPFADVVPWFVYAADITLEIIALDTPNMAVFCCRCSN